MRSPGRWSTTSRTTPPTVGTEQIGHIVEVGDGIARVSGLPGAAVNELLEFEDGTLGLALNLDEDPIGAVVLGEVDNLEEEQIVKATGRIQTVPVGDALLGRVVNALGEPLDGKGPSRQRRRAGWRCRPRASSAANR